MELILLKNNYCDYYWVDYNSKERLSENEVSINPLSIYAFHGDVIDEDGEFVLSPTRYAKELQGVLKLDGNSYGRIKDKLYYKCIPNNKLLPHFLVPYENKVSFNKINKNKYISFQFKEWKEGFRPIGTLLRTFGDVDDNDAFMNYDLACKYLDHSLKDLNKETSYLKTIDTYSFIEKIKTVYNVEDRTFSNVFSIDPPGCKDIDDAMGMTYYDDERVILSIYIANVPLILDYCNLWSLLTDRVSTIYLPHTNSSLNNNKLMLPSVLSEELCSLHAHRQRFALAMDVLINISGSNPKIEKIEYKSVLIQCKNNYAYDEPRLSKDVDYRFIFELVKSLNQPNNRPYLPKISDSHHLVEYLMVFMNHECSKKLIQFGTGIFRSAQTKEIELEETTLSSITNKELLNFITNWKYNEAYYSNVSEQLGHKFVGGGLDSYVHITSPIRRLVDTINITLLQTNLGLFEIKYSGHEFCGKWIDNIEYINGSMKAIKKVQNNCNLLYLYSISEGKTFKGYVFDKSTTHNEGIYKYNVYLPEINKVFELKSEKEYPNYSEVTTKLYLFNNEHSLKQKIRLNVINYEVVV